MRAHLRERARSRECTGVSALARAHASRPSPPRPHVPSLDGPLRLAPPRGSQSPAPRNAAWRGPANPCRSACLVRCLQASASKRILGAGVLYERSWLQGPRSRTRALISTRLRLVPTSKEAEAKPHEHHALPSTYLHCVAPKRSTRMLSA